MKNHFFQYYYETNQLKYHQKIIMKLWNMIMGYSKEDNTTEISKETAQAKSINKHNTTLKPGVRNTVKIISGERIIELPQKLTPLRPQPINIHPHKISNNEDKRKGVLASRPLISLLKDSSSSNSKKKESTNKSIIKRPLPQLPKRKRIITEPLDILSEFKNLENIIENAIKNRLNEFIEVKKSELELKREKVNRNKEKFNIKKKKVKDCEVQTDSLESPRKIFQQIIPTTNQTLELKTSEKLSSEVVPTSPIISTTSDIISQSKDLPLTHPSIIEDKNTVAQNNQSEDVQFLSSSLYQTSDKKWETALISEAKIDLKTSGMELFGQPKQEKKSQIPISKSTDESMKEIIYTSSCSNLKKENPMPNLILSQQPSSLSNSQKSQEAPKIDSYSQYSSLNFFTPELPPKQEEEKSSESNSISNANNNSLFVSPTKGEIFSNNIISSPLVETKKEEKKQESNPFIYPPSGINLTNIFGNTTPMPQTIIEHPPTSTLLTHTKIIPSINPINYNSLFGAPSESLSLIHSAPKPPSIENPTMIQSSQHLFGLSNSSFIHSTNSIYPENTSLFPTPLPINVDVSKPFTNSNVIDKECSSRIENKCQEIKPPSLFGNNMPSNYTLFGKINPFLQTDLQSSELLFGRDKPERMLLFEKPEQNVLQNPVPAFSGPFDTSLASSNYRIGASESSGSSIFGSTAPSIGSFVSSNITPNNSFSVLAEKKQSISSGSPFTMGTKIKRK